VDDYSHAAAPNYNRRAAASGFVHAVQSR